MKLIIGILIGFLLATSLSYALRLETPVKFTNFSDKNELANLNFVFEKVQEILNGKYTLDVETSVPTVGDEGDMKAFSSGGTYRLYLYLNGGWRSVNLT